MVIYTCDSCKEKKFKQIDSAISHLKWKHNIHILYQDLRCTPPDIQFDTKYYCKNCLLPIKSKVSLFKHISEKHNVSVWYIKRRSDPNKQTIVYLDGLIR